MPDSVFPGALDTFTQPSHAAGDTLATVPHDLQHRKANDALLAIEKRLFKAVYNVFEYGATGDGVADDTAAIQAAIDAAFAAGRGAVHLPAGIYKITSAITVKANTRLVGAGSFLTKLSVTGSGYTAVTVTTGADGIQGVAIEAPSRQASATHGLLLGTGNRLYVYDIQVTNFNGRGVYCDTLWDSMISHIVIVSCGSATHYAFEVGSSAPGETTNETVFQRIQVELSYTRSIYIGDYSKVLHCDFAHIHSERSQNCNAADPSWVISGTRCTFENVRMHSNDGNGRATMGGDACEFRVLTGENMIDLALKGLSATRQPMGVHEVCGVPVVVDGLNPVNIYNSSLPSLEIGGSNEKCAVYSSQITMLRGGVSNNVKRFVGCEITDTTQLDITFRKAQFIGCVFGGSGDVQTMGDDSEYIACHFLTTLVVESAGHVFRECKLFADLILNASTTFRGSTVAGTITRNGGSTLTSYGIGRLGHSSANSTQGGITTTETDITGLSVTVTVPANSRIRVSFYAAAQSTVANDVALFRIRRGSTQVRAGSVPMPTTNYPYQRECSVVDTPSAGSHTYKVTLVRGSGTGTLTSFAAADDLAQIVVEDIGPA